MDLLRHTTTGHFVVATESGSRYLLDFDAQVFVRLPREVEDSSLTLRGDFYQVRLLELVKCVVGERMQLRINLGVRGVLFTDRETTPVVAIAEVPDGVEGAELEALVRTVGEAASPPDDALQQLAEEVQSDGNR